MPEQINPQLPLQDYIKDLKSDLRAEIEKLTVAPADQSFFITGLKNKYRLKLLKLEEPKVTDAIKKKVPKQFLDGHWIEQVREIKVTINYEGDKTLFNCKPVPYTRVFPQNKHQLYSGVLIVYFDIPEGNDPLYEKQLNAFLTEITKNQERINNQADIYNDDLQDFIENLLKAKLEQFNKEADFLKKIGLHINPRADEFITPQPVQRKMVPQPSAEKMKGRNIPVLESRVYNDIKEVLYNVGRAMERKPSLYLGKREEHLRDIFLLFLETRYESTSGTGEAFNKKGKTDILLKYAPDGSNIFVAECKIWKGQKELFKAIDQLLSYLTWQDTRTALMIFVKNPDFSKAIEVVSLYVNHHPLFKRFAVSTHNTTFTYEMSLPGDPGSSVWMEFMLFHFPS